MASSEEDTRQKDRRKEKERLKDRDRRDRDRSDKVRGTKRSAGGKDRRAADDSEDDIEKEKEKDKMAFLAAIKGLRDKDKAKEKARRKKAKKCSSSRSPSVRKDRKKDSKRKREQSRSRDDSSGSPEPPPKKELITASGFGAPLALPVTSIVPAAVGASDVIGVFCRSAGADQNSEQALRALPVHLQQLVMAEGSIAGLNPSAVLMGRIRKVENNAGAANAAANAVHRPRPETVAAAAAGDPVAKFCMLHQVDYSAENALRALPVELQCKILNEGPLRASNPSAVLMSRIRKAQTLLAEMRRLGKVPV